MYWITGILGAVSIVAPLLLGYTNHQGALWTSLIVGTLLMFVSILEGLAEDRQVWEYVVAMVLGAATLIAPFVLGFSVITEALLASIVIGVIIMIAAGSKLTSGEL